MTKFSANRAGAHGTGSLGVTRCSGSTKRADVLRALEVDMLSRLALEASYGGGSRGLIGDNNGVSADSQLHNHFQSSGEHNMSSAHSRSCSSVISIPTPLSWHHVSAITFPGSKKGGGCAVRGKWGGMASQLGKGIDHGVSRGQRFSGGKCSGRLQRSWFILGKGWYLIFLSFLNCSLHPVIGAIVHSPLFLRQ